MVNGEINKTPLSMTPSHPAVNAVKATSDHPPGVIISPRTGKPKRRKATRACVHCQRTHLTCDNNRPCERCIARGLAATCQDGTRKKAKYLQDIPEPVAGSSASKIFDPRYKKRRSTTSLRSESISSSDSMLTASSISTQDNTGRLRFGDDEGHGHAASTSVSAISNQQELMRPPPPVRPVSLFTTSSSPKSSSATNPSQFHQQPSPIFTDISGTAASTSIPSSQQRRRTFESSATTQEYSVLSSILHGNSASTGNLSLSDVPTSSSPAFSDDSSIRTESSNYYHANYLNQFSLGNSPRHNLSEILANVDINQQPNDWLNDTPKPPPISFTIADTIDNIMDPDFKIFEEHLSTVPAPAQPPPQPLVGESTEVGSRNSTTPTNYTTNTRMNNRIGGFSNTGSWQPTKKPADIYRNVRQPFPYTPGFHSLIKYLKARFDKSQLIQMAKCMARYRPSFIACTNSLDQDDLVFMEQCFQRTLLEYEKYISYSGTPTAIWRRTGQIAAVGKEFCILTGWSRQQLLDRDGSGTGGMFVVEVMQDESVLEYFQMFSDIAFGDSRGAMMSECSLLTPNGKTIKTSSMWTLQRDVFGIPMMIIGNFLPILS